MKLDEAPLLKVQIKNEQDVVQARQRTRQICANLGFPAQDQTRMATAISELARNVFQYAGQGLVEFAFSINRIPQRLWVTVRDQGPGIANLAEIQSGQYVSTTGMGLGLMGAKKLTDAFEIESTPGQGTRVRVGKDLPKHAKRLQALHLGDLAEVLSQQRIETPIEEVER